MKKEEKKKKKQEKVKYLKPVLTKHKKLKDMTGLITNELGCTKSSV